MLKSKRAIEAMLNVDRRDFCTTRPYEDAPQGIGYNATISAPHMHAYALEAALPYLPEDRTDLRVLDVGSGSGYLCAAFAHLVGSEGKVFGVEHVQDLVDLSRRNVQKHFKHLLENGKVHFICEDGRKGFAPGAPYDVIHVGASSGSVPQELVDQTRVGGVIIIPVGDFFDFQEMSVLQKQPDGSVRAVKAGPAVRYVPLTSRQEQWPEGKQ